MYDDDIVSYFVKIAIDVLRIEVSKTETVGRPALKKISTEISR